MIILPSCVGMLSPKSVPSAMIPPHQNKRINKSNKAALNNKKWEFFSRNAYHNMKINLFAIYATISM